MKEWDQKWPFGFEVKGVGIFYTKYIQPWRFLLEAARLLCTAAFGKSYKIFRWKV